MTRRLPASSSTCGSSRGRPVGRSTGVPCARCRRCSRRTPRRPCRRWTSSSPRRGGTAATCPRSCSRSAGRLRSVSGRPGWTTTPRRRGSTAPVPLEVEPLQVLEAPTGDPPGEHAVRTRTATLLTPRTATARPEPRTPRGQAAPGRPRGGFRRMRSSAPTRCSRRTPPPRRWTPRRARGATGVGLTSSQATKTNGRALSRLSPRRMRSGTSRRRPTTGRRSASRGRRAAASSCGGAAGRPQVTTGTSRSPWVGWTHS
mmetsp:Transcript_36286/g.102211  ORF Transcript_36286/g.102211 Transcript_36286/m.102211 type:complete len:258 (+) Transcript_36286:407-1180(+)